MDGLAHQILNRSRWLKSLPWLATSVYVSLHLLDRIRSRDSLYYGQVRLVLMVRTVSQG